MKEINEKLEQRIKEAASGGKLSCTMARKIAKELGLPVGLVGETADALKIKIASCELGCF